MQKENFYPRPPGGGRPGIPHGYTPFRLISIHALRVEGDYDMLIEQANDQISIHALRVEGDSKNPDKQFRRRVISIHALRVEGDGFRLGFSSE